MLVIEVLNHNYMYSIHMYKSMHYQWRCTDTVYISICVDMAVSVSVKYNPAITDINVLFNYIVNITANHFETIVKHGIHLIA